MIGTTGTGDRTELFARAYQAAADRWPVPVASEHVPTRYGGTHVLACGSPDAPPVLLLQESGTTAVAWRDVAGGLARAHRVIAVDPPGHPGLSSPADQPPRTAAELAGWLDEVLDGLAVRRAAIAGHSYGAWLALRYALHAPERVSRLVLLDPTDCFARMNLRYRLRAIPVLARPAGSRMRRFLAWETGGRPLDEAWLAVAAAGQDLGRARIVLPRRPSRSDLAGLRLPVLVIVAGQSRAHDPRRIARRVRDRLPAASVVTLPQASHHSIPASDADELLRQLEPFL
ncbi:MAG: alpha/beta fold hydrolase [Actinobacteria bacterium]|nr:alpha/beta fold hydrolase [Actinomycetota bacterium]